MHLKMMGVHSSRSNLIILQFNGHFPSNETVDLVFIVANKY